LPLLALLPAAALASVWLMPKRPLTEREQLALTVSRSEAIVAGTVVSIRDTMYEAAIPDSGGGLAAHGMLPRKSIVLRPSRWLKGSTQTGLLEVGAFEDMDPVLLDLEAQQLSSTPLTGLFFLRKTPVGWMVGDYPGGYLRGRLVPLDSKFEGQPIVDATSAVVARQSLDSLLDRADLAIVGHWKLAPRSPHIGKPIGADSVVADRVLIGPPPAGAIFVTGAYTINWQTSKPNVLFLSRVSGNHYEAMEFEAGADVVQGDSLARAGITLAELGRRAEQSALRRSRAEGVGR
jgi:hypothetical protein